VGADAPTNKIIMGAQRSSPVQVASVQTLKTTEMPGYIRGKTMWIQNLTGTAMFWQLQGTSIAWAVGAVLPATDGVSAFNSGGQTAVLMLAENAASFPAIIQGVSLQPGASVQILGSQNVVFQQNANGQIEVHVTNNLQFDFSIFGFSVAAATVETVEATSLAGSIGQEVLFCLSAGPVGLTTVADTLTYVAIKGTTSGIYYAFCFAGQGPVTGRFKMQQNETLGIVVRNQDTIAHIFSAHAGEFANTITT
jgi:hypothetical protein